MGEPADGVRWSSFADRASELASDVEELIDRFGFALVGTIRRDGTPRISPVEVHLVGDDLMLVMLPRTRKAADVRRDDRIVLQSPITNAGDPGAEFKLRGRAFAVEDRDQTDATANEIESSSGWRPGPTWLYLALMLQDVTHAVWSTDGSAMLSRWSVDQGMLPKVRLLLDMEAGGYRLE